MTTSPVKIWRNRGKATLRLGTVGRIISWTIIRTPPLGFEQVAPYPVILVETESGERLTGQLVDWEERDLRFQKKVEAVYRRIRKPDPESVIPYGIKFKPI